MNEALDQLLLRASRMVRNHQRVAACLLVETRGSTPQPAGALMLIDENAAIHGTIGGGCVEAEVRRRAHELLVSNASGLLSFKLDHDFGWDDGLICGGTIILAVAPLTDAEELERIADDIRARRPTTLDITIHVEGVEQRYTLHLPPRERILIAGAGHIGQALARQGLKLEFEVAMFDERADLLERFAPEGAGKNPGEISDQLALTDIDDRTYCVIVTRGHRHDEQALAAVINRGAKYVGMIGSRRKTRIIFDELKEIGISRSSLEEVHAPIGIDIGSVTVEEIALSIAAELVGIRRRDNAPCVTGPFTDASASIPPPPQEQAES